MMAANDTDIRQGKLELVITRVLDAPPILVYKAWTEPEHMVRWMGPNGPESVETDLPTKLVGELGARFGGEVPELVVERPSLEDVYLRMIGHQS